MWLPSSETALNNWNESRAKRHCSFWSSMRGIVTLAATMAVPATFPYCNFISLTASAVVLATLLIQGLTLKPLLRALDPRRQPVQREFNLAREEAYRAGLDRVAQEDSPAAKDIRNKLTAHMKYERATAAPNDAMVTHDRLHRRAIEATRQTVLKMRASETMPSIRSKRNWTGSR